MGREARCRAHFGDQTGDGKALLETTELIFRGADLRFVVPLAEVKAVEVVKGELVVRARAGVARLVLGDAAKKWAEAIKNPRGRLDKLGVKVGMRVVVLGVADDAFRAELRARIGSFAEEAARDADVLFYGAESRGLLAALPKLKRALAQDGALWIVRPKGSSAISEAEVMAAGKAAGLVNVKVVAFSPTHTAEKFVIPVAARKT